MADLGLRSISLTDLGLPFNQFSRSRIPVQSVWPISDSRSISLADLGLRSISLADLGFRSISLVDLELRSISLTDLGLRSMTLVDFGLRSMTLVDFGLRSISLPDLGLSVQSVFLPFQRRVQWVFLHFSFAFNEFFQALSLAFS